MLSICVALALALNPPPEPATPETEPLPAGSVHSVEFYEWVVIGQLPDGAWVIVAAKKYLGQSDDTCAVRAAEAADGTLLDLTCSGKPKCTALSKDCYKKERQCGAELVMVMCLCLTEASQ